MTTAPQPTRASTAVDARTIQSPIPSASQQKLQTQSASAVPTVPPWITVWKDSAAALQSSLTIIGIIAGAVWFLRRRQRFPRANVTHAVRHWSVEGKTILHTVVRVENLGEVVLRLKAVNIRAQQLLPTPDEPLNALRNSLDPVKHGETEVLWPSICERSCDWSQARHEVEPGETEEIHFDMVLPGNVRAVEVYTYIKNHVKRGKDIGWGTNTFYAISETTSFAGVPAAVVETAIPAQERIPIMATSREPSKPQDTQKQQGQKTPTSVPGEKRQGPEKTSTSTDSGGGKK